MSINQSINIFQVFLPVVYFRDAKFYSSPSKQNKIAVPGMGWQDTLGRVGVRVGILLLGHTGTVYTTLHRSHRYSIYYFAKLCCSAAKLSVE